MSACNYSYLMTATANWCSLYACLAVIILLLCSTPVYHSIWFRVHHSLLTWTWSAFMRSPISGIEVLVGRQRSQPGTPASLTTVTSALLLKRPDRGIIVTAADCGSRILQWHSFMLVFLCDCSFMMPFAVRILSAMCMHVLAFIMMYYRHA